jgi:hypothetical protein
MVIRSQPVAAPLLLLRSRLLSLPGWCDTPVVCRCVVWHATRWQQVRDARDRPGLGGGGGGGAPRLAHATTREAKAGARRTEPGPTSAHCIRRLARVAG